MEDWAGEEGIKLSTEHSGKSQLNLGHLVDSKLEKRGSGYELRSDGFGALRAGSGMLISTDKQELAEGKQIDMTAGMNQLQIVCAQADGLTQAASVANAEIADLKAENQWLKDSVNELREAVMLLSSPKGIALATPDRISVAAGKDVNVNTSAGFNVSTMRNVVLAATNAISLFAQKMGLKLYAAHGKVQIQAQSDAMELVAQQNMQLCSAAGTLTANAANGVVLSGGGSAYIKVQGDNVEIGGAGNLILKIIEMQKEGPGSLSLPLPKFSQTNVKNDQKFVLCDDLTGRPLANRPYRIEFSDGKILDGKTNENGETSILKSDVVQSMKLILS